MLFLIRLADVGLNRRLVALGRLATLQHVLLMDALHDNVLAIGVDATVGVEFPLANLLVKELVEVETVHLGLLADAQVHAGDVLDGHEQDAADGEGVDGDCGDFGKLLAHLHAVAVDAARVQRHTVQRRHGLVGEDSSQETANHAADAVQLEHVQTFVNAQPGVDVLAQGADDGCQEPDDGC